MRIMLRLCLRKPFDQTIHVGVASRLCGGKILIAEPLGLPLHIASRPSEFGQTKGGRVEPMQIAKSLIHSKKIFRALDEAHIGEGGIPEDPALDQFHQIELGSDNFGIDACAENAGDRYRSLTERALYMSLAVDCVRAFEEQAARLAAQDVVSNWC